MTALVEAAFLFSVFSHSACLQFFQRVQRICLHCLVGEERLKNFAVVYVGTLGAVRFPLTTGYHRPIPSCFTMRRPSKYLVERRRQRHRQRKILSLEERVQAIHLYDRNPVYMRVASELKCSWEQIKNVVQNRDAILSYYARCQAGSHNDKRRLMRQQKITFLGQVMYEYVKRVSRHEGRVPDDAILREKALLFRSILGIPNFLPNKMWVSDFKNSYKLNVRSLKLSDLPESPVSLNCKDIIAYCRQNSKSKLETQQTVPSSGNPNERAEEVTAEKGVHATTSTDFEESNNPAFNQSVEEEEEEEQQEQEEEDESRQSDDDDKIGDNNTLIDFDDEADEEINENEEGPTIDFGDYEYMEEEGEEEWEDEAREEEEEQEGRESMESIGRKTDVTLENTKALQEKKHTQSPQVVSLLEPVEPPSEKKIPTHGSQKTLSDAQPPPKKPQQSLCDCNIRQHTASGGGGGENDLDTTKATACNKKKLSPDCKEIRVDDYADALNVLGPLEEFALLQEDFRAVNLLSQLVALYRNRLKRKRRTRT